MRFLSDFEKSSVLHTFAHWVVKFWATSIYSISIESYWHRRLHGCPILCVRSLTHAPESFQLLILLITNIFIIYYNIKVTKYQILTCMIYWCVYYQHQWSRGSELMITPMTTTLTWRKISLSQALTICTCVIHNLTNSCLCTVLYCTDFSSTYMNDNMPCDHKKKQKNTRLL